MVVGAATVAETPGVPYAHCACACRTNPKQHAIITIALDKKSTDLLMKVGLGEEGFQKTGGDLPAVLGTGKVTGCGQLTRYFDQFT